MSGHSFDGDVLVRLPPQINRIPLGGNSALAAKVATTLVAFPLRRALPQLLDFELLVAWNPQTSQTSCILPSNDAVFEDSGGHFRMNSKPEFLFDHSTRSEVRASFACSLWMFLYLEDLC